MQRLKLNTAEKAVKLEETRGVSYYTHTGIIIGALQGRGIVTPSPPDTKGSLLLAREKNRKKMN